MTSTIYQTSILSISSPMDHRDVLAGAGRPEPNCSGVSLRPIREC
jgi:hypothetical protein